MTKETVAGQTRRKTNRVLNALYRGWYEGKIYGYPLIGAPIGALRRYLSEVRALFGEDLAA